MSVILSIKPEYCEKIRRGNKRYEFRRRIFSRKVSYVYMYSSSPVKRIVGIFGVESIIEDDPKELWEKFKDFSGISEEQFFEYFGDRRKGFAIKIKEVKIFEPFDPKMLVSDFSPPQSYLYIKENIFFKPIGTKY